MPTTEITIGQGTQSIEYLLGTNFHDRRVQVIYLASEIGQAGAISALALNVATPPGATLNNWTIRMRHFTQSAESGIWIVAGAWDTVYQGNEPPGTSGWLVFNFSQPFEYNGSNNLEIDFSFNNSAIGGASGTCFYSTPGGNRTLFGASNSANGDPLNWTSNVPLPTLSDKVPNIRLIMGSTGGYDLTVNVSPAGSGTVNYNGGTFQAGSQLNLVAQANVGWVFDHWGGNATGTNPNINLTMDSNKSVAAYFKAVQHTLTISKTAGGSVTAPGEGTFTHNYGQQVPLVAVPDTGYRFVNWTGDVSTIVNYTAASTTITMNGNATITANFALSVTIPGDVNGDGQVNIVDLTLVAAAFGSTMSSSKWNAAADINQDGMVNIFDLVIVGSNFGGQVVQGDGSSPDKAGLSVKAIKANYPGSPSGVYWIDPDGAGGGAPFAVYADMSADGGGWMLILSVQDPGSIWSGYAEGPIGGAANMGYFDGSALGNPSDPSSNYRLPKTSGAFELIGATEMLVTRSDLRSQKFTGLDSTALDGFSTYYDSTNHDGNAIGGDNYWHIGSNNRFGSPHLGLSVGGPGVHAGPSPNNDPNTLHYGHFHVAEENIPRWCWGEEVSSTPYRYRYYLR